MLIITKVAGPLITAKITKDNHPMILETVYVGPNKLLGEVINVEKDECKIQVYEETSGLQVSDEVELRNELLSVELAPGLMGQIFDGIQRPLEKIEKVSPVFIRPGLHIPALDRDKKWDFIPTVQIGEEVVVGSKLGYVQETELVKHYIMVPPSLDGKQGLKVKNIAPGEYTIQESFAILEDKQGQEYQVQMLQKWPVKVARKFTQKLQSKKIFKTGQRVIDALFPILLGARVSTPGPFGAGKTFTQQQTAKWSNAQIVVYVGCGERGNEMTEMVKLFPKLSDPHTGKPLMDRTVLIANTSNMPIAAREASIYTGVTIAEYFRDMGYDVVLMADSTSRWAEAMREISQRLGEMPSEEGFPAYLGSKISAFYDRAGVVETLSGDEGSVTAIGTVSPPGGDFSEAVTQTSLKNSQVFLALDEKLASQRHYPSINWDTSYSLYEERFSEIVGNDSLEGQLFVGHRIKAKKILSQEGSLLDIVKLVGADGLDNEQRLIIEIAKSLREDFLQQNGFDKIDTYCSFDKTMVMLANIINLYEAVKSAIQKHQEDEEFVAKVFSDETKIALSNMKYKESLSEVKQVGLDLIKMVEKV